MSNDPFDLDRFVVAQENDYEQALAEVMAGQKRTHWMWYVFPQLAGLGRTSTAQRYGIRSVDEARAYLAHSILGPRLLRISEAAFAVTGRSAHDIFGSPDDLKLRSSATLFSVASAPNSVFERLLEKFYGGVPDRRTLELLEHV